MKNILFILSAVLLILLFSECYSDTYPLKWYDVHTGTTENINFINSSYIIGNRGAFLKWQWRYLKWMQIPIGTNENLNSCFGNWLCGANGTLYETTNSGANWFYFNQNITDDLNSIAAYQIYGSNTLYHFMVTGSGNIYYTSNTGGWIKYDSANAYSLNSVAVNKTYALGTFRAITVGNNGTILLFNGFISDFRRVLIPFTQNLNCVAFADSTTAFAVGDNGLMIKSTDYGSNWSKVTLNTNSNLNTVTFQYTGYYPNNGNYGIAAGDNGTCFTTTDKGVNWYPENTSFNYNFRTSRLDYYNSFILAGDGGKMVQKTYDSVYLPVYRFMPNNIKTTIINDGTFNSDNPLTGGSAPGFIWPKDSACYAVFTSGFNLSANVNNIRKMATASFSGEYKPGSCSNGIINTDPKFKLYKVRKNESPTGYDYLNWEKMVPYGAPYHDRNHNGVYEPGIDIPGVKGADETVFLCMTDADPATHNTGNGFGGGTPPLFAEVHLTMWGYNTGKLKEVIFMKYEVINKSPAGNMYIWDSTFAGFFYDYDIGEGHYDYMGCDSIRNLAFGYHATDSAMYYGYHPPAVGVKILRGFMINNIITRASSAIRIHRYPNDPVQCEIEPEGRLGPAVNVMKGFKNDGTKWVVPGMYPPQITKFTFSGDPESGTGWIPSKGRVSNCGDSLTGTLLQEPRTLDTRFVLCTGGDDLRMNPGDTQIIYAAQLIAKGYNNLNSVTRLKELSDSVEAYYNAGFPINDPNLELPASYVLSQNYPNPFNAVTKIKFELPKDEFVTIKVYDVTGRLINTIVNRNYTAGRYEITFDARSFASGVYFYRFESSGLKEVKKMVLIK